MVEIPEYIEICRSCCLDRDRYEVVYRMSTGQYYCGGCGAHQQGEAFKRTDQGVALASSEVNGQNA